MQIMIIFVFFGLLTTVRAIDLNAYMACAYIMNYTVCVTRAVWGFACYIVATRAINQIYV